MEKKRIHQDVFVGFFCLALCLLIYVLNNGLPAAAAMMPKLLDGMLVVLSVLIIYHGLRKSKNQEKADTMTWDDWKIPVITWGLVVVYIALFYLIGYLPATGIMLVVLMRFMKRTSWPVILGIDVAYLLIMYFVFARMLNVNIDNLGMLARLF